MEIMFDKLQDLVDEYAIVTKVEEYICKGMNTNQMVWPGEKKGSSQCLILAICTPLMARAHKTGQ